MRGARTARAASATARPRSLDTRADHGRAGHVTAIAAGESFSLALAGGSVYAWGLGSSGQLGLGSTSSVSTPTIVPGLSNVIAIAAGNTHSLAVTSTGALYAWGANGSGQLGDEPLDTTQQPDAGGVDQRRERRGRLDTQLALTTTGEVWAWGAGWSGQLGQGNTSSRNTPGQITGLSALRIAAGVGSQRRRAHRWRARDLGQQRQRSAWRRDHHPTQLADGDCRAGQSRSLALGDSHTMAATADGEVWTWGAGGSGQLGQGTTTNRDAPDAISEAAFAWRVATPAFSVTPGHYTSDRSVIVTVDTPGATIHYTQNGDGPDGIRSDDRVRRRPSRVDVADAEGEGVEDRHAGQRRGVAPPTS